MHRLAGRVISRLSCAARLLINLGMLAFFVVSISTWWVWPDIRSIGALVLLAAFFLDASKKELGSFFAFFKRTRLSNLSIDSKLLGLMVLVSMAVNAFRACGAAWG